MKHWNPQAERLLLQMHQRKMGEHVMCLRFGCGPAEIRAKLWELQDREKPKPPPPQPLKDEPSPTDPNVVLDPTQRAFLELCERYNSMGESLKNISDMVSRNLSMDELAEVLKKFADTARHPSVTFYEHLARLLCDGFVIVPRLPATPQDLIKQDDGQTKS